jgi:hypothetical protein
MDALGFAVALAWLVPVLKAVAGLVTAVAVLVRAIIALRREIRDRRSPRVGASN